MPKKTSRTKDENSDKKDTIEQVPPDNSTDQATPKNTDINVLLKKLKRVLYLTESSLSFMAGDSERFFLYNYKNTSFVSDILEKAENVQGFLDVLRQAGNDPNLPRRGTPIFILALSLRLPDRDTKITNALSGAVLEICKTDEEFFNFIHHFKIIGSYLNEEGQSFNKITTSVSRVIRQFFNKKTPSEYLKAVASHNGYHSWKYKDLIKLSHYKSETAEQKLITEFVLHGFNNLKEPETKDLKDIYGMLQKWHSLRQPITDIDKVCQLIFELKATPIDVNSVYLKKREVWEALIPNIEPIKLMQILPKFLKYNMFEPKETSGIYAKVKETLSVSRIESARCNPLEIFNYLINFKKGGKAIDPKLEQYLRTKSLPQKKAAAVKEDDSLLQLLYQWFNDSYQFIPTSIALNKKVTLILHAEQFETPCFKQRNMMCTEAEIAIATYFKTTDANIDIAVFSGENLENFELEKGSDAFTKNVKKLRLVTASKIKINSVFERAIEKKHETEVFIFLLQSVKSLPSNAKDFRKEFKQHLTDYVNKTSIKDVKIVVICLGSHNMAPFPEYMGALTINGFCPEIPKAVHYYVNLDHSK